MTPMPNIRKRKPSVGVQPTTVSSPPPPAKRRKQQRLGTPTSFWDNLSRQWLTRRALREFDRRTVWSTTPSPPHQPGKESVPLTQLKRFARHGGPSLSDLRAYPESGSSVPSNPSMTSCQCGSRKRAKSGKESDTSLRPKKSSAYDPAFEQHLIDHGVYPQGHEYGDVDNSSVYPDNWEEINNRLTQPRPSLSPSRFPREEFRKFDKINTQALTEATVMSKVFPIITGTTDIPSQENLPFGNFKDLTDGSITKAQPDLYDGSRPADLEKCIRDKFGQYIIPSTNLAAPYMPNFFTEGKGPNGNTEVCKRQALYDGALGARAIHKLRSYVDPPTAYDNNAYSITSTYHSGLGDLTIYTTHPTRSNNTQIQTEYRMTKLNGWKMTGNPEGFRQGASALRNARNWAKEKREELIAAANGKALQAHHSGLNSSTQSFVSLASDQSTPIESDTSATELALGTDTTMTFDHGASLRARTEATPKASSNRHVKKPARARKGPCTRSRSIQKGSRASYLLGPTKLREGYENGEGIGTRS